MYHFEYHQKSELILRVSQEQYPWLFASWLSDESIEARYYLLEYLQIHHGYRWRLEKDPEGKPVSIKTIDGNTYWSLSHSEHFISFIISDTPVGIDIAEYEERDISLLDMHHTSEYEMLGRKDWEHFYILWTAKESLIKSVGDSLDDLENISLLEIQKEGIYIFWFLGKTYTILSQRYGSLFVSTTE